MASRGTGLVVILLTVAVWVSSAPAADVVGEFFSSVARDTKRRNCWPRPFVYADRQSAREPFAVMVANGWQRQNMLVDGHFDAETGQLTESGRQKILGIMREAPQQHRAVFIHRAATPQQTAARIAVAEQFVAQSTYGGQGVPVLETQRLDEGISAERVDSIYRKFGAAVPEPKLLPKDDGGGSSK